jgi:hypothetical protein
MSTDASIPQDGESGVEPQVVGSELQAHGSNSPPNDVRSFRGRSSAHHSNFLSQTYRRGNSNGMTIRAMRRRVSSAMRAEMAAIGERMRGGIGRPCSVVFPPSINRLVLVIHALSAAFYAPRGIYSGQSRAEG